MSALRCHVCDFLLLNYCSAKDAVNCFVLKECLSRLETIGRFVMFRLWEKECLCVIMSV